MSTINSRALQILGRLYRFIDGRENVSQVEMDLPVQLVHDVAREVELNSVDLGPGVPGFFQVGQDNVHAGATLIGANTIGVYTVTDSALGAGSAQRYWVWLMWAQVTTSVAGTIVYAMAGLESPALGSALALRDFLFATYNGDLLGAGNAAQVIYGVNQSGTTLGKIANVSPFVQPLPMLIPPGGCLNFYTSAGAAATIRLSTICWVGPIGTMPPGLF